jgi:small subunit ribosomal protein S16
LRRIGTKGRPFYRVVVAKSTAARNGSFVETIGSYDPIAKPKKIEVNSERALHWLRSGAQPTETTAYLLNKTGVLEQYFQERPGARKQYGFLDKRTAATSVASVVEQNAVKEKKTPAPVEATAPVAEPVAEVVAEPTEAVTEPVAEAVAGPVAETPAEPVAEATAEPEVVEEAAPETTEEPASDEAPATE